VTICTGREQRDKAEKGRTMTENEWGYREKGREKGRVIGRGIGRMRDGNGNGCVRKAMQMRRHFQIMWKIFNMQQSKLRKFVQFIQFNSFIFEMSLIEQKSRVWQRPKNQKKK